MNAFRSHPHGISIHRRSLAATALGVLLALACAMLLAPTSASADPKPGMGVAWPMCGTPPDNDGYYCVESQTMNGAPIVPPATGTYEEPYVDLIGSGDVRFGVYHTNVDLATSGGETPTSNVFRLVVHTGTIRPRELYGHIQDAGLSIGGNAASGWTFTLTFRPVKTAWNWPLSCFVDSCADNMADLLYDGFVTGYVTDLAGWTESVPGERALRTGFIHAYNAEDALQPAYDAETNSIVIRMANPHFASPGVVATGVYETFIPNAMLTGLMHVPDPSSLTGGSFEISRGVGAVSTSAPFTLTHTLTGVQITITGITFSSPTYRIHVKHTRPGAPRLTSARRTSSTSVRVRFRKPLANGGLTITRYIASCKQPHHATHSTRGKRSPLVVRNLPRNRVVYCWVKAVNAKGKGAASRTVRVA